MSQPSLKVQLGILLPLLWAILGTMFVWAVHDGGGPLQDVFALDRQHLIYTVEPKPPNCINLDSEDAYDRTLVVAGQDLDTIPDVRLQFQWSDSHEQTMLSPDGIPRVSAERITLDMRLMDEHLEHSHFRSFQVRIADAAGRGLSDLVEPPLPCSGVDPVRCIDVDADTYAKSWSVSACITS